MVPQEVVAVDRHYFQNTGAYDPLLSLWGSENLEMSFKVGPMSMEDVGGVSGAMYVAWRQVLGVTLWENYIKPLQHMSTPPSPSGHVSSDLP